MERCIKSVKEELGPLANHKDIDELCVGVTNATAYSVKRPLKCEFVSKFFTNKKASTSEARLKTL